MEGNEIDVEKHIGHKFECIKLGAKIQLECLTCDEELIVKRVPLVRESEPPSKPDEGSCSMDGDCVSCGS